MNFIINLEEIENVYQEKLKVNTGKMQHHLKSLRPNLANPACKKELDDLNELENKRSVHFNEVVDDTQYALIDSYSNTSDRFFKQVLNTTESFLNIYSALFFKDDFIQLPGGILYRR